MNKNNDEQLNMMRHSAAHLLAAAVNELYPGTKFGIGPVIDNGFYYDFDFPKQISEEDLPKIEAKMEEIKKKNLPLERLEVPVDQALSKMKEDQQNYKVELIEQIKETGNTEVEETVCLYKLGEFTDLCRGPHVENTSQIGAFKLLSLAGAYWRGNEKNKMLTRIYGTSFLSQKELDEYQKQIEEAKKRDHRRLGRELDLFSVDEYVGPGLILWHPKLSIVREEIEAYWRREHRRHGYQYIYTPHVGLSKLWETSGHLDFYKDGMYPPMSMAVKDEGDPTTYYVKPMSCPFHIRIYNSRVRSYKEFPIRWAELGTVYRYEESGVLHGLLRVRGFTQDDAHIFCTKEQFASEVAGVLNFAIEMNKVFGFAKLNVYLSVRDPKNEEKYVGKEESWEFAEKSLKEILDQKGLEYVTDLGEAKFYGPAIDLKVVDSLGREWQGTTIQLDFCLPQRFGMTYIGPDGHEHTPVMIHRTLLGSMERFVGTLIEHYSGSLPVWLSPIQVEIIPITSQNVDYTQKLAQNLRDQDIRVEVDERPETMQAKIRDAQLNKIPFMLIVGNREEKENKVAVRLRSGEDLGAKSFEDITAQIKDLIDRKASL